MSSEEQAPRPMKTIAGSLLFLAASSAAVVGINAAMMPYRTGGGMFLGWLLCLIAVAVSAGVAAKLSPEGAWFLPVILFALFSCVYGIVGGNIPRLVFLRETPLLTVKEAAQPPHDSADVFHFSDGRVSKRYHWTRRVSRKMLAAGFYHVAPVLPEGWKESDPITLWAVGEANGEFPSDAWRKAGSGGYREISDATYRNMIEDGVARSHLVSAPRAPLIQLEDDPREALRKAGRFELWCFVGVLAVSLVILLLPLVRKKHAVA